MNGSKKICPQSGLRVAYCGHCGRRRRGESPFQSLDDKIPVNGRKVGKTKKDDGLISVDCDAANREGFLEWLSPSKSAVKVTEIQLVGDLNTEGIRAILNHFPNLQRFVMDDELFERVGLSRTLQSAVGDMPYEVLS